MNNTDFSVGIQHRIFNNEIRKRRLEMGLTQDQLGELSGLGGGTINHFENFRVYPSSIDKAKRLAEVLDSTVEQLFPEWLKIFKPKRTSIVTEHIIKNPLIDSKIPEYLLTDGETEFEDMFDKELLKEGIEDCLNTLSDREKKIIKLRFGFERPQIGEIRRLDTNIKSSHDGLTYEEVAEVFGVTRERIRQIEAKALRKLKHPTRKSKLECFI